ncbi:hypothetical protein IGI04_007426 [Brassica rapa subsp. trilocularis]|uniref:RNase H type-1 domain-containing protein n=1 Tax=Brassica rapa subsp. trilocularis TaxID=1813537 RepID=A0ABQ7NJQ1_BRACM|nr:hypothetical protein IGI04_007426 [Brassica rapa subsp. trilocularis]
MEHISSCRKTLSQWRREHNLNKLRNNNIVEPELDRDSYPWIIWYLWNAKNDKLFREIDKDPLELVRYAEKRIENLKICFPDFKITHIPRTRNQISDFLARTTRSFHRVFYFIGCSIPVGLPRPPKI